MKKTIIYALLLVNLFSFQAFAGDGKIFSYGPDGKNYFSLATDRILIGFNGDLTFEQKAAILGTERSIKPITTDDVMPAPAVTIANVNGLNEDELQALLKRLNGNPQIAFANPFVIYSDGTYQGIQDRIIVRLKSEKDLGMMHGIAKDLKLTLAERNEFDPMMFVLQTTKQTSGNALEIANRIHESNAFEYAEPDFLLLLKRFSTNDPNLGYQWSLNNTGSSIQYNGTPGADMDVFNAWGVTHGSSSVKVAVIDEGVDLVHPDLVANLLAGYDATGQGSNGGPSGNDAHGTACAGIIAAVGNNNLGVAGVAYGCKIIPVRIAYSNAQGNWVTSNTIIGNGLNWAWQTAGAHILSNSWGGGSSSTTINNAITSAVTSGRGGLGSPVLFAAGNDNGANSYPATQTNTISVIAMSMCYQRKSPTSCDGETFWGSNYGTGADVAAPGVKIATCDISGSAGYSTSDYTGTFNGTSSATPNTAGVMALILSANPNLTFTQARFALESTCEKVGSYTYNANVSGQPNGTWSNDLGYGLVNAYQAILSVTPQVQNDAGISAISSPVGSYCTTSVSPSVTLNNFGSNTLSSVVINYQVDGGSVSTYNWSGSLASTNSTVINLPAINVSTGSHTFTAYTSSPNGTTDGNSANNSKTSNFVSATNALTLTIVLDNYPEETSWDIKQGSTVVATGGTYGSQPDGSTVIENICVVDGCFTFTIYDAYGDGICCSYGSGSYVLKNSAGVTLASGAQFTSSQATNFCVQSTTPVSASISSSSNVSCFGGANGSATASATGGTAPYSYWWSNGATGASVSGLSAGTYTVTVTDANSGTATAQVTITQPSAVSASVSGVNVNCNGGATGSASVSASGGVSPYTYSWSNGGSTNSVNGLVAGSYSVTVTDNNGCTAVASVTINNQPDSDNDGVCDAEDQCPGSNDALIGTACNDGNDCTVNDVYDTNCGCSGTLLDSDNDGICDSEDQCPGSDDALIGTACNDGNACTVNDIYDANCGCSGTYQDSDNDGVCDGEDQCPGSDDGLIGTACNDGNDCTVNDVYDANCGCSGTLLDSDNDGVCDSEDQCPGSDDALIGTACNDGNACTVNDIYDANCGCSGTYQDSDNDGVCDGEDQCSGGDDAADADGDGTPDFCDSEECDGVDNDGDGDVDEDCVACEYSTINSNNFEVGLGIWVDGGSDCARSSNGTYANSGTYSVQLRDNTGTSVVSTGNLDLSAYNELTVSFSFMTNGLSNGEDFWLQVSSDGGLTYSTVQAWVMNTHFVNNQRQNVEVVIAGPFAANTRLRFRADASTDSDIIHIDDVVVSGCKPPLNCTYQGVNSNNFESSFGIWTDGGTDCARSSNGTYASSGSYTIQLRDNTSTSVMSTGNMDLSAYQELTVSLSFITGGFSTNEDFWLQVSSDGGVTYTTVYAWAMNRDFVNGMRENPVVIIPGPFSSTSRLRFRCDASTDADVVYIDDVVISGCQGASARLANPTTETEIIESEQTNSISAVSLYPNPTNDVLNISLEMGQSANVDMVITDLTGKLVYRRTNQAEEGLNKFSISVYDLPAGIYLMTVVADQDMTTKRFVIQR